MKNLLLATTMLLALPLTAMAGDVTDATTLKITSPDGLTNVQNLTVKLSTLCRYRSGIFWPESKSCGGKTVDLKIAADGTVKIPAVEKLDGLHGNKVDNYEVSVSVYEGNEYLAILSARGKEALKKFNFDKTPLAIYRVNAANVNLSLDGADFFGSEASKVERAMLGVSVSDKNKPKYSGEILVVNSLEGSLWSRENFASYAGKKLLKDATVIDLPKLAYAKFNGTADETIVFSVYYTVTTDYTNKSRLSGSVEVPLKASALEEIGSLELKK